MAVEAAGIRRIARRGGNWLSKEIASVGDWRSDIIDHAESLSSRGSGKTHIHLDTGTTVRTGRLKKSETLGDHSMLQRSAHHCGTARRTRGPDLVSAMGDRCG